MTDTTGPGGTHPDTGPGAAARLSDLPAAAQRALAEAEDRRRKAEEPAVVREVGGRDGPDPVRFGDWEKKGIAIDF